MRWSAPFLCLMFAACEPPPEVQVAGDGTPSIEILEPINGQELELGAGCTLQALLLVYVANFELRADLIGEAPAARQGHWHGGPDLTQGYCRSAGAICEGSDVGGVDSYDGTGLSPGPLTLQVQLQENDHNPIDANDQVEVTLVDDVGGDCP